MEITLTQTNDANDQTGAITCFMRGHGGEDSKVFIG